MQVIKVQPGYVAGNMRVVRTKTFDVVKQNSSAPSKKDLNLKNS
jgi:hypothetical protein